MNDKALANLSAWVPAIFPTAKFQPGTGGLRVSSKALGRNLQEDLAFTAEGIKDFGIADQGDPNEGKRTAIDIVIEYRGEPNPIEAAKWLCGRMGVAPQSLGWGADDAELRALGDQIARNLDANDNSPRKTIIVDGVTIDAESGEIIGERASSEDDRHRAETVARAPAGSKPTELETINAASSPGNRFRASIGLSKTSFRKAT